MNKYLITGASGFVGQYFVSYVRKNEPSAQIMGIDIAPFSSLPISYRQMDLNDYDELCSVICSYQPHYIVHLASISSVGQSWKNPSQCFQNNTSIMLHLLEAVKAAKLQTRILAIGSSEEYGSGIPPFKETSPLCPQNPYGVAKVSQELLCRLYVQSMGLDIVMTRSFNHIGPKQREQFVVPAFLKQIVNIAKGPENKLYVGNLEIARDFTDVRDVVNAYYQILHNGLRGEVYNVCSGKAYPLYEIIKIAGELLKIEIPLVQDPTRFRPDDVNLIYGDRTKLSRSLNWLPKYSLQQTIQDIIEDLMTRK